jgi:hypothetical protein
MIYLLSSMSLKSPITTGLVSALTTKSPIAEPSLSCYSFELVRILCALPLCTGFCTSDRPLLVFA